MPLALISRQTNVVLAADWPLAGVSGATFTVAYEGPPPVPNRTRWTGTAFEPFTPPRPITKLALYGRMTDAELATLDGFLQGAAPLRQRLRWADATEIDRNDPEVRAVAEALFGPVRAAELLA
jgi:hypothetical protein